MKDEAAAELLHGAACSISSEASQGTAETTTTIVHVSGQPAAPKQTTVSVSPAGEAALQDVCFSNGGHQLHYSTKLLGSGGYAHVVWGQEALALSVPDLVSRLTHLLASHKTFTLPQKTFSLFGLGWLSSAPALLADRTLIKAPVQMLTALSEDVRKRAFKVVQQLGLVYAVPEALLNIRPCAVKVLTERSCYQGAYGRQSAENEVLISLHVSQACADCAYVGKAHGFEYAVARPLPPLLPGALAKWLSQPPAALLLALEPYTIDLEALAAERQARLAAHEGASANDGDVHMTPPDEAPDSSNSKACVVAGDPDACRRSVNLWEYLVWLRGRKEALTVQEMRSMALQLAQALHALHTQAHVMHLDVKPHNCLLTDDAELRLVDFGFAAAFKPEQPFITVPRSGRGTPHYTAPEMAGQTPRLITPAADMYSFGCCLLTLCASSYLADPCAAVLGAPAPYTGAFADVTGAAMAPQLPWQVPEPFRKLILRCLRRQPATRPDAAAAIAALQDIPDDLPLPPPQFDLLATPPELLPCVQPNEALCGTWHSASRNVALVERPRRASDGSRSGAGSLAQANKRPAPAARSSSSSGSSMLRLALSAMSSAQLSRLSSGSSVLREPWGNSVAPEDLGTSPRLQQLCVAGRCSEGMRYTKSVRQDLAAVMRGPPRGVVRRRASDQGLSRSVSSSDSGGSTTVLA